VVGRRLIERDPDVSFEAWGRELLEISFESGASFGFKVGAFTLVQLIDPKEFSSGTTSLKLCFCLVQPPTCEEES